MSEYAIIESIQNAKTLESLEKIEKWINELMSRFAGGLANMALIKRWELLTKQYSSKE